MSNFHPLEVVNRGSETQLQVGEKLNKITLRLRVSYFQEIQNPVNSKRRLQNEH